MASRSSFASGGGEQAAFQALQDEPMIDLGSMANGEVAPLHGRQPLRWRNSLSKSISLPMAVVIAAVIAAAAGAVTHYWELQKQRLAEQSALSIALLGGDLGIVGGWDSGSPGRVLTSVIVVNLGPMPVEVASIRAATEGLSLLSVNAAVVKPGITSVMVWLRLDCSVRMGNDPISAAISVRTADGNSRHTASLIPAKPWQQAFDIACVKPGTKVAMERYPVTYHDPAIDRMNSPAARHPQVEVTCWRGEACR